MQSSEPWTKKASALKLDQSTYSGPTYIAPNPVGHALQMISSFLTD